MWGALGSLKRPCRKGEGSKLSHIFAEPLLLHGGPEVSQADRRHNEKREEVEANEWEDDLRAQVIASGRAGGWGERVE